MRSLIFTKFHSLRYMYAARVGKKWSIPYFPVISPLSISRYRNPRIPSLLPPSRTTSLSLSFWAPSTPLAQFLCLLFSSDDRDWFDLWIKRVSLLPDRYYTQGSVSPITQVIPVSSSISDHRHVRPSGHFPEIRTKRETGVEINSCL